MPHAIRILITGANGQVGWELMRRAQKHGIPAIGLTHAELDITRIDAVRRAVRESKAGLVINAAAYTAVDKAETEKELAFAVNRDGPANLAAACAEQHIPLIHLSTDYVFDGTKPGPYTENDPVAPLSVYGASKEAGERAVRERLVNHIILRTAWVYGIQGHNFVKTILRLARERDELRIVADQHGCPTAAGDIADAVLFLVSRMPTGDPVQWGTYHYCGKGVTTWHEFAKTIIEYASPFLPRPIPVRPITTADYPTPARRPANSVLDCSKITAIFGITPRPWRVALREVIEELHGHR